jgi:UV DNA damage endonuclease
MRLGYACINSELRAEGIFTNRTARVSTIENSKDGVKMLIDLAEKNLADLMKILEWNVSHNIFLFRISSGILPHLTNNKILKNNKQLYSPNLFADQFREVGTFDMRLTFHPDPYIVINSPKKYIVKQSIAELGWHSEVLDLIDADSGFRPDNIIVVHGGGVYDDKEAAKSRWIYEYTKLPIYIRRRVVLENDEIRYSLDDVVEMHDTLRMQGLILPIVLDWFHFKCFYGFEYDGRHFNKIIDSWHDEGRTPKMHISEQKIDARFGSHSDYVSIKTFKRLVKTLDRLKDGRQFNIDIMIEAKAKELSVILLEKFQQIS